MIVFPMAGLSRRFSEAGYGVPKYMLPIAGGTCFDFSVAGFLEAYHDETFLFVMRDVRETPAFVEARLRVLGLERYRLVVLDRPTSGQAETVELGLHSSGLESGELTIFNIDTFRLSTDRPNVEQRGDGYLEVFVGSGAGWSFVKPLPGTDGRVERTTEKDPVSDLCSTGLYSFRSPVDFLDALDAERRDPTCQLSETYIAPIYNHLVRWGRDIRFTTIPADGVVFCGVPNEYEALLRDSSRLGGIRGRLAA